VKNDSKDGPAVDARIDELYQQPLDNFVAARNALAKTLSGEEAQRVRKLSKPTVVPWAVNQLYWRARATYDRLIKAGASLRQTQIASLEGHQSDLPAAIDAHRRAIADAVKESERLALETGAHPDADALTRTLESLSLAAEPPARPGRLTEALRPAGFEALAGIQPAGVAKPPFKLAAEVLPHTPTDSSKLSPAEKRKRDAEIKKQEAELRKQEAERQQRETDLKEAERALERAAAAESKARDVWEHAHDELIAARQRVAEIKKK
jgi:hypothetical protein